MSDEDIDIKISPSLDETAFSQLKKKLDSFKNPVLQQKPDSRLPPRPESASKEKRSKPGFTKDVIDGKNAGASAASGFQSDLDEGARGGFYNAFSKKVDLVKNIAKKKEKDTDRDSERSQPDSPTENNESNIPGKFYGANPNILDKIVDSKKENDKKDGQSEWILQSGNKEGKFESAIFRNVKIDKMDAPKLSTGNGGSGFVPPVGGGGSSSPGLPGGNTSGTGGGIAGSMAKAIPIAGVAVAGMVAGALKLVSDVGQRHVAAIQSQSGTLGATGGYVGGGQGYFSDSEYAQSGVGMGKVSGRDVYKKKNLINKDEMKFAASQGVGLSEVTSSLEKLRMGDENKGINYYRGAAQETGFKGLRQNEYLSQLSGISENFRKKGFSADMTGFTETAAGINRTDGQTMDPSRRMSITERTTDQAKKGVFGGGITGAMSMSLALQKNKGDFNAAMMDLEKNSSSYGMQGEMMLPKELRGIEAIKRGESYSEATSLSYKKKDSIKEASPIEQVGYNQVTAMKNKQNQAFSGETGLQAAKIGFEMQDALIKMFDDNKKEIGTLAKTIHTLESGALQGINSALESIKPVIEKLVTGDITGAAGEVMDGLVNSLRNGFKVI